MSVSREPSLRNSVRTVPPACKPAPRGEHVRREADPRSHRRAAPVPRPAEVAEAGEGRAPLDLFLGAGGAAELLAQALEAEDWLDAYLYAASLSQLIDDHCAAAHLVVRRAAAMWLGRAGSGGASAGRAASALDRALGVASAASPTARRLTRLSDQVGGLVTAIAPLLLADASPLAKLARHEDQGGLRAALSRRGLAVAAGAAGLAPLLGTDVVRMPSCFFSFDLHPRDLVTLAEDFARRFPDCRRLSVVGLRSSGCYLAPLLAAALRDRGFRRVDALTARPGWALAAARGLRRSAAEGGLVLLVDDPPGTGRSIAIALDQLRREAKIPASSLVLVIPTFGEHAALPALPDRLSGIDRVELASSRWDITRRLSAPELEASLTSLLGTDVVVQGQPEPLEGPRRGHARVRVRVSWQRPSDSAGMATVVAEGAGLGPFARRAVALARTTPTLVPQVIGAVDGVLFSLAPDDSWRLGAGTAGAAQKIARHLAERHRALALGGDPSLSIKGRRAAWEIASDCLARPLGPLAPARLVLVDPLVRRLLSTARPCVVDGDLWAESWYLPPQAKAIKTGSFEGTFGHNDLASCDPVFDVAGVAVAVGDPAFGAELRHSYERWSGALIEPERWMLLQLVHLFDAGRHERMEPTAIERRCSAAVLELFASRLLADLPPPAGGEVCVLDLDGVLECSAFGFPAIGEQAALALRALRAHGKRVLLASGRSLDELVERCRLLDLEGAVAEYGAAGYVTGTGEVIELVPAGDRLVLDRLRSLVQASAGLRLDGGYSRIVRCSQLDGPSRRRPVEAAIACRLIEAAGGAGAIVAVHGGRQTDFVPAGLDKAGALARVGEALGIATGGGDGKPFALAVGDSAPDRGFLSMAQLAYAPSHSELAGSSEVTIARRAYQAGTAEAVGRILGHAPGSCPTCAAPPLDPAWRALSGLLSLHEAGSRGVPLRLALLAGAAVRAGAR